MANKKDITLRQGNASPKNIVLHALPVSEIVTTTIFLYPGAASAKDITLRDPTVVAVAGTTNALTATGIATGAPSVGAPAITQVHVLTATGIASSPTVGTPVVGQSHVLTGTGIATGAPTVDTPAAGQIYVFSASGITATPEVGSPAIGQTHVLALSALDTGAPTVDTPVIGQSHVLSPTGVATGAPSIDLAVIGQEHVLAADGLATGAPVVGAPLLTQNVAEVVVAPLPIRRESGGMWIKVGDDGEEDKPKPKPKRLTKAPDKPKPVVIHFEAVSLSLPPPEVGTPKLRRDDLNEVLEIMDVFKVASMMKAA